MSLFVEPIAPAGKLRDCERSDRGKHEEVNTEITEFSERAGSYDCFERMN